MTREEAIKIIRKMLAYTDLTVRANLNADMVSACNLAIKALEQEPQTFKWCTDCKEYDQEKHCCHRWSKVIRNTVEEMKQEYMREVLDKIRAEIEKEIIPRNSDQYDHEAMWQNMGLRMAIKAIDKYKAETEVNNEVQ